MKKREKKKGDKENSKESYMKLSGTFKILIRYLTLLVLVFLLPIFYKIFTPLTIYPVILLLKLFLANVALRGVTIIIGTRPLIQLIPACIAGSAYLLLIILNLSVKLSPKKRIFSLIFSCIMLLILNILRIFFFSILYINKSSAFDFTHKVFWYALSTIFVVGIWFLMVRIFSIKEIPFYSDIKSIISNIKD